MPLLDQIQKDMVAAMKAKDEARLSAVRMLKSSLQKYSADNPNKPLDEATEMQVLNTIVKQRREAMEMFRSNGREELAAKEEAEMKVIAGYLPSAPTDEEVDAAIAAAMAETGATTKAEMGLVMNATKALLAGKFVDGKALSEKVRAKLN